MKKSILSFMLTVFIVCNFFPIDAFARTEISGKHGSDFTNGELAKRLETVFYLGVSGCVVPALPAVGGSLDKNTWYTTAFLNQSGSKTDQTCQAYARAAYSYLFGYDLADGRYRIEFTGAKGRNSLGYEEFIGYGVRCGAYLRTTNQPSGKYVGTGNDPGHSLIILGFDPAGVTTLEGNYDGNGKVGICYYTWQEFNDNLLAGNAKYVCSFSQPTEETYAALGAASGGSVNNLNNLGEIAAGLAEQSCYDLGLPANNWCVYFIGHCINNSSAALAAGEGISNEYSKNPMTLINWICAKKQIGTYYSFSPAHYNRLANAYGGLSIISTDVGEFTPMPGDIIVYNWNGRGGSNSTFSHAGIVTAYNAYSSTVTSVEGNTATGNYTYVKEITHDKYSKYIIGYIRLNAVGGCTVTFDPNGGSVYPLTKTVAKGGTLDSLPIATRSGYTFAYWSTAKEGSGAALMQDNYKWMTFAQDTILYATWWPNCVSHKYEAGRCIYCGELLSYDNNITASDSTVNQQQPSYNGITASGSTNNQQPSYQTYEEKWGAWSDWSSVPVSGSSTREVETRQIKLSDGSTEYRYGRFVDETGMNAGWCASYWEKLGYRGMAAQYSGWTADRYPAKAKDWTCGYCSGSHIGVDHYSNDGRGWWKEYVSPRSGNFFWEESRQTEAVYETQYRYRDWTVVTR